jgi:hypothetical protein
MLKFIAVAFIAALLVGCEVESPPPLRGPTKVTIIHLPDGTRCALYDAYRAGGLSCDWGGPSAWRAGEF